MSLPERDRRIDRWAGWAIALGVMAYAAFALWAPIAHLTFRSTDDSYYYFQVARNIVRGYGVTFDQIHATNGFHPLWMLCLLPVCAATGGAGEMSLRLTFCLVALVAGAALWIAYRCLSSYAGRSAAVVGLVALTVPPFLNPLVNGLETGLLLLLLFFLLWTARRYSLLSLRSGTARNVILGLLLALLFLARLDSAFIVLGVLAAIPLCWMLGVEGRIPFPAMVRKSLEVGLTFAVAVAPYFVWNETSFGHLTAISGGLKTSFPVISFHPVRLTGYAAHYGQALLLASMLASAWLWLGRRSRSARGPGSRGAEESPRLAPVLLAVGAGCCLHFVNSILFMGFGVHWWHFASYAPLAVLLGTMVLADLQSRVGRPALLALAAALAMAAFSVLGFYADYRRRGVDHERWLEAALWARRNLPADAVVGMTDCGLFGYFSERRTVNLDGVINGYPYQEALQQGRLREFLDGCRMTHVATSTAQYEHGRYIVWLPARLHRGPGGAIVGLESAEVYRSQPYNGMRFAIWERALLPVFGDAGDRHGIERLVDLQKYPKSVDPPGGIPPGTRTQGPGR
jgi:hypothetical protein